MRQGVGELAGALYVQVRTLGHLVSVSVSAQNEHFASAIRSFEQAGRFRILVLSQSVRSKPLVFEPKWIRPQIKWGMREIRLVSALLSAEGRLMGKAAYLTCCEAETPADWKERLAREAA